MGTEMAIKNIYAEREKFIIIGLTGRTGSGCTTVSDILKTDKFEDLCLHEPKTTNFESNEERKYQIIYNYAKEHWDPFYRISMTDVIFSFIFQYSLKEFIGILSTIIGNQLAKNVEDSVTSKYPELDAEFQYINNQISTLLNLKLA